MWPFSRRKRAEDSELVKAIRRDGWRNIFSKLGDKRADKREGGTFDIDPVQREEALALWHEDSLARAVIETLPADGMRRGFSVDCGDKDTTEEIGAVFEDLKFNRHFVRAGQMERALGGAAMLPMINDGEELFMPLDESSIVVPKHITLFEPRELRPVQLYTDANDEKYGYPEIYRLTPVSSHGLPTLIQYIHETRLIIFPGIRFTREEVPGAEMGWGGNVLTRVRAALRDLNMSWSGAAALIQDFSQAVIKIKGLASLLDKNNDDAVIDRLLQLEISRSIIRAMAIDADDSFERVQTPMGGLPELLVQFMTWFAAQCDMPVTRLFGISPAGLNATGQSDIQLWDDRCEGWQDEHMPQAEQGARLILLANDGPTKGKEPKTWSVKFNPLRTPDPKTEADRRYVVAQADEIYINLEVVSREEVAKSRWGGDTYSSEMMIDWKARDAQKTAAPEVVVPESRQPVVPPQFGGDPNAAPPVPGAKPGANGQPPQPPKPGANGVAAKNGAAKATPAKAP